jgi:hypothetical protein
MAWSGSRIFEQAMLNPIGRAVNAGTAPTGFTSLTNTSEVFVALYSSNTITPDATVAVSLTGYNTGQWVTGGESSGTGYTAGGQALSTPGAVSWALDTGSASICYHASSLVWTTSSFTAFGCLVYDNNISAGTVAKQGMCYNFFGGSQTVTTGTFTINWATVGATTAVFNIAL